MEELAGCPYASRPSQTHTKSLVQTSFTRAEEILVGNNLGEAIALDALGAGLGGDMGPRMSVTAQGMRRMVSNVTNMTNAAEERNPGGVAGAGAGGAGAGLQAQVSSLLSTHPTSGSNPQEGLEAGGEGMTPATPLQSGGQGSTGAFALGAITSQEVPLMPLDPQDRMIQIAKALQQFGDTGVSSSLGGRTGSGYASSKQSMLSVRGQQPPAWPSSTGTGAPASGGYPWVGSMLSAQAGAALVGQATALGMEDDGAVGGMGTSAHGGVAHNSGGLLADAPRGTNRSSQGRATNSTQRQDARVEYAQSAVGHTSNHLGSVSNMLGPVERLMSHTFMGRTITRKTLLFRGLRIKVRGGWGWGWGVERGVWGQP